MLKLKKYFDNLVKDCMNFPTEKVKYVTIIL